LGAKWEAEDYRDINYGNTHDIRSAAVRNGSRLSPHQWHTIRGQIVLPGGGETTEDGKPLHLELKLGDMEKGDKHIARMPSDEQMRTMAQAKATLDSVNAADLYELRGFNRPLETTITTPDGYTVTKGEHGGAFYKQTKFPAGGSVLVCGHRDVPSDMVLSTTEPPGEASIDEGMYHAHTTFGIEYPGTGNAMVSHGRGLHGY
jgi:hypothetical protein